MSEKFTFREYQKSDEKYLQEIIRTTWKYDKFTNKKTARRLSQVYLFSCLSDQTYTQVVLCNDMPVGIIMAKNNKQYKLNIKYKLKQILTIIPTYFSKEGKKAFKIFSKVEDIDTKLLKKTQQLYEGELAFFVINQQYRGKGLGKQLFNKALTYFKQQKIKNFYLYTDTSCNFNFYKSQGMIEKCSETIILLENTPMTFYLYDYTFE